MLTNDHAEAVMRILLFGWLSGLALLNGVSLAAAASSPPFDTQTAASFLLSACQGSADNLNAVAALAEQQKWTSMLDPNVSESGPLKVTGMWRVGQNSQSYAVTTGVGPRGSTSCLVTFNDPKPDRNGFIGTISHTLSLKTNLDQADADMRKEMYQIVNLTPKNVVLQVASGPDGKVFEASIIGQGQ
jgi:hypothetical protein